MNRIFPTLNNWRWALFWLVLWAPALRAQTQIDPTFGPMRVYQPATVSQVLVLSTGERLILSGNLVRASGVDTPQRLVRYTAAGGLDAGFALATAGYTWLPSGLADGGNGRVLVTFASALSSGGQTYYGLVRLLPSGAVDVTFAAQPATLNVSSLAVQPDGKVVVAGRFTMYNGQPVGNLARLNADGTLDFAFLLNNAGGLVAQTFTPVLALQVDGKIVVGGSFQQAGGQLRSALARFNADGSLDAGFVPATAPMALVGAVAVQPDGRILAGNFNNVPLVPNVTQQLVRFTATGAYDNTFITPPVGVRTAFSPARTLLVQPDGRILFSAQNGQVPPGYIMRLTSTGAIDPTWNVPISPTLSASVNSVQLLPGGQVVFGGGPQPLAGPLAVPVGVGQLTATGAADGSVSVPVLQAGGVVRELVVQPDGKVVVAGTFTEINGTAARGLARLQPTGAVDAGFTAAASIAGGYPNRIKLQPDGKVVVAGRFNALGGTLVPSLARVLSTGALDPAFAPALFASGTVNANSISTLEIQADGRLLLVGFMQLASGAPSQSFLRLLPGGGLDAGFQPAVGLRPVAVLAEPSGTLLAASSDRISPAVQRLLPNGTPDPAFVGPTSPPVNSPFGISGLRRYADGRVLVFGNFTLLGGVPTASVARLSPTGAIDPTFVSGLPGVNVSVQTAQIQPNARVLVAGSFTGGGLLRTLARLLPNGANDPSLDPSLNPNNVVFALAVQANGDLLVGGQFDAVGAGPAHLGLVRLLDANVLSVPAPGLAARTEAWPVPAHEQLHLRLDAAARPGRVDLRDALGRTVLSQSVTDNAAGLSLNVAALPAGVYLLQVHYRAGGTVVRRVIID